VTQKQEDAFKEAFMRYYGQIHRHLHRLLGNKEEADDVAQLVFMRFHEHFAEVEPDKAKAWLYKTATRHGLNTLRGKKRFRRWQEKAKHQPMTPQDEQRPPEELLLEQDERAHVRATLSKLAPRDARILSLFFSGLKSYKEIAEEIDVQPGSVGTLLARAKRAFKKEYASSPHTPARRNP
tara:strand:- start:20123 stop:20662 length:540 start_codon:yes stop_codon:yes gene_type:complete